MVPPWRLARRLSTCMHVHASATTSACHFVRHAAFMQNHRDFRHMANASVFPNQPQFDAKSLF
jgi:hypothetical protein